MGHNHQMLDVRKNGAFILSDALLVDYRQQRLADLLNELMELENRLESTVRRSLKDDERLLGQEKANIVNLLQSIVRTLTSLHLKLSDVEHAAAYPQHPEVSEGKDGYLVKGKMNVAEVNVSFSIEKWAKTYFESAVENLVREFQKAAEDHKITLEEKIHLTQLVAAMLVQSVQAFYLMRTGAVFK
ncbi:MAG: hypothetical protein KF713_11590 [Turneriella sp.]|nr:hypothetical protein [Turneriella sp.]